MITEGFRCPGPEILRDHGGRPPLADPAGRWWGVWGGCFSSAGAAGLRGGVASPMSWLGTGCRSRKVGRRRDGVGGAAGRGWRGGAAGERGSL